MARVLPGTVWYICGPLVPKQRRGRPIYQVPLDEHEQILASLWLFFALNSLQVTPQIRYFCIFTKMGVAVYIMGNRKLA